MLQKWKTILTNWINCYFNESPTKEAVSLETIITIISHLRENLNLDESKSSVLEAHTVEEFIVEKYPEFKFENDKTEPTSEEDLYVAASLLLLFVCVNSKDVDIKNAMCSKLSIEDQEIIMKFSKYLMECSCITHRDVQNAITEACGQVIVCTEASNGRATVAETPPALRSLHGEVRRLQAALDAERFDRNYLQDELARTNLKLEKLLKDKEQYKLDIVALKSKISLCCGQEAESKTENGGEGSSKLVRELQQMEMRLVETQGQLDDVMYERDTYKAKIDELKQERDKWLSHSQQESARVGQLTSELELERRHVGSLKELVSELRQHNQLNRLDASHELDDVDTSLHSVHNSSVCSEVCANVVEVQLGEERAKIVVLTQQIQSLQEQLNDLNRKSEEEKLTLQKIVSEREEDILNLKHRINEEIEEKNYLKLQFNDQISRLHNDVNELELRLTENTEQSRKTIEGKMQEIQTLQEEKLSLLQSLSNETTKLNNVITNLVSDLDAEKASKINMKDDYENNIMKLKEKVLNRNNELVELQNKISEAGERLEDLHAELRNERQARQDDIEKYGLELEQVKKEKRETETLLQQKIREIEDLTAQLSEINQCKNKLDKTLDECKQTIAGLHENCRQLHETKVALENEIDNSNIKVEEILKDMENMRNKFTEENTKLLQDIDERNATITTLQTQLQNEIEYKMKIQHELSILQEAKASLVEDIDGLNLELLKLRNEIQEKDKTIIGLDLYVQEEKKTNEKLKANCDKLNEKLKTATNEVKIKENHIKQVQSTLKNKMHYYDDEIRKYNDSLQLEHNKLMSVIEEKGSIQMEQEYLIKEKSRLESLLQEKSDEISQLRTECENMMEFVKENKLVIESLEEKLNHETSRRIDIGNSFDTETSRLMARLNETEKSLIEQKSKLNKDIKAKELEVQSLNVDLGKLQKTIASEREKIQTLEREKNALLRKLEEEVEYRKNLEKEYQTKCINMSDVSALLNTQIERLKNDAAEMSQTINDKQTEIINLKDKVRLLDEELKKEIELKMQVIESLEKEKEQLHYVIEEDNSVHEELMKGKDNYIDQLKEELKVNSLQLEALQKDYEETILTLEKYKVNTQEIIDAKDNHIQELESSIEQLKSAIDVNSDGMKVMEEQMIQRIEGLLKDVEQYKSELAEEKAMKDMLENEKTSLAEHKDFLEQTIKTDKELLEKKNALLNQQYIEEKSTREQLEEQIKNMQVEKVNLEQELAKEMSIKKQLEDDKECLTQQLVEEKSAKELAEQERQIVLRAKEEFESKFSHDKDDYSKQIVKLLEDSALLGKELENERTAKQALQKEVERLASESKEVTTLKDNLVEEYEKIRISNSSLIVDVDAFKQIYEKLTQDYEKLVEENEQLKKLMKELQAALNDLQKDKNDVEKLLTKACEENDRYKSEIKEKQQKVAQLDEELTKVMKEHQAKEEVETALDTGIEKISETIKKEELQNEMLQKLTEEGTKGKLYNKCECLVKMAVSLVSELSLRKKIEKTLEDENSSLTEIKDLVQHKEVVIHDLQNENKKLQDIVDEKKIELSKQIETNKLLEAKQRDMQKLQHENQSLQNELNDVKVQLEVKVHSLKEKLVDNEHLTEKLKKTYECQIDNLNVMVNKLTNYLKDKTAELECVRRERDRLQSVVDENSKAIKTLEEEIKTEKQNQEKLISDFENERLVLKNMVTVTESVMEDQKTSLNKLVAEYSKANEALQEEKKHLNSILEEEKKKCELTIQEKEGLFETALKEMSVLKSDKEAMMLEKEKTDKDVALMKERTALKDSQIEALEMKNKELESILEKCKNDIALIEESNKELENNKVALQANLTERVEKLTKDLQEQNAICIKAQDEIKRKTDENVELQQNISNLNDKIRDLNDQINELVKEKNELQLQKEKLMQKITEMESNGSKEMEEINKLTKENSDLLKIVDENKTVITNLEQLIKHELEQNQQLRDDSGNDKINLTNKCYLLQEYQTKAERELDQRQKEIAALKDEVLNLKLKLDSCEFEMEKKIANVAQEKDVVIGTMSKELRDEQMEREKCKKELDEVQFEVKRLRGQLEATVRDGEGRARKEKEVMLKAAHVETSPVVSYERPSKYSSSGERDAHHNQVDNTSDYTQSSMESLKTISDLEKIITDKNRTITTLQSDVTYMKTIMAESENKLLDVTKELEVSKENCHQLSVQLKKIVHQKNEEIAELKKQVSKMSVTENRATQIIKVSAKYQAIILKRIAEIKNNTVLKELTNYGNNSSPDNDLRRSLNAGTITMEDLENFLETTERHIRKCSEKQMSLQKERDRLTEVNKINESEIINIKKFLTELSVSCKTFSNIKELYAQKLSRVVSVQRTVRREILSLDGRVNDATMCKLERGYAAVMQDLSECCMNMERWVERCLGRTISPEKIKQAFSSDSERASLASTTFQNTSLEVQLDELEKTFQKLLEEVVRAQKGDGARDPQAVTVMEVRAEYEDKLNRMKAKMKQLYQEQIAVFQEKQKKEIASLEKELQAARSKLAESSKAYEDHIRGLTMELWDVGQKFLVKKDEAEWLKKKQRSGSLISLQHVHSSGLVPPLEEVPPRPSDTHSLRSLPVTNKATSNTNAKREGRGLHVSDEEGEVFDNRWLQELSSTPRAPRAPSPRDSGLRLSELRWRNSLCPPHLKSSYPAETQFAPVVDEEDIKMAGPMRGGQRKEVGITAYKKPGPPTPSKQAGRLSATDSELRESLRVEADPQPSRKTSTPSRIRALFKIDKTDGTPRAKRLSIFRKK